MEHHRKRIRCQKYQQEAIRPAIREINEYLIKASPDAIIFSKPSLHFVKTLLDTIPPKEHAQVFYIVTDYLTGNKANTPVTKDGASFKIPIGGATVIVKKRHYPIDSGEMAQRGMKRYEFIRVDPPEPK